MDDNKLVLYRHRTLGPILHPVLSALARRKRLFAVTFLVIFGVTAVVVLLTPNEYQADMAILMRRERSEPLVSPDANTPAAPRTMSEQEVNSEVDLLKSRELLERVAVEMKLAEKPTTPSWKQRLLRKTPASPEQRLAGIVDKLDGALSVDPPNKSNMIRLHMVSDDPKFAADALNKLGEVYIRKHIELHSPPGTYEVFAEQAEQHRKTMDDISAKMAEFTKRAGVVSAQAEKDSTLHSAATLDLSYQQTQADIAAAQDRIRDLEKQLAAVPQRKVTQVRTSSAVPAAIKSQLFQLEQKRTELLQTYDPSYRLVKDIDEQIASARKQLADAESNPVREETVDQDTTYSWITGELARARAELASLRARAAKTYSSIGGLKTRAALLDTQNTEQQELLRAYKTAEENYLLYTKKQEQARISEALDRQQIANVAIAQMATPPAGPTAKKLPRLVLGMMLALLVSFAVVVMLERSQPALQSAEEVSAILEVPVLATISAQHLLPASRSTHSASGGAGAA